MDGIQTVGEKKLKPIDIEIESEERRMEHEKVMKDIAEAKSIRVEQKDLRRLMMEYEETRKLKDQEKEQHIRDKREQFIHPDRAKKIAAKRKQHKDCH